MVFAANASGRHSKARRPASAAMDQRQWMDGTWEDPAGAQEMKRVAAVLGILASPAVMVLGAPLLSMGSETLTHGNPAPWLMMFLAIELLPAAGLLLGVRWHWFLEKRREFGIRGASGVCGFFSWFSPFSFGSWVPAGEAECCHS